jgi:hypothetical protein
MPTLAQVGLHLDNNGIGLHYRAHPEKKLAFESNLSLGFAANPNGLYYSQYSASAGLRLNFYRSEQFSLYSGLRANLQFMRWHQDEVPIIWNEGNTFQLGNRSALNLGYTIPIGVSWLIGENKQWEWFIESGLQKQFGERGVSPYLKVGLTYFFNRK